MEHPDDDLQVFPHRGTLDLLFEDTPENIRAVVEPYLAHTDLTQRSNRDELRTFLEHIYDGDEGQVLRALQRCYIFDTIAPTALRRLAANIVQALRDAGDARVAMY